MWNSIKNSLPKEDEWVLVSAKEFAGDDFERPFVAYISERHWHTIEGSYLYSVSHWMPIPEIKEG